ncbi:peptidase S8 [Aurantiacibacter xanthus]|uniref:Peptidase S8 n=1 Tax=Aurantiacibacter xanthus TaxID=1784712 RepID=A0A3A1PAY7_9SPHN|nr:peptidase S8 [Aurantiacibacter xanthus]
MRVSLIIPVAILSLCGASAPLAAQVPLPNVGQAIGQGVGLPTIEPLGRIVDPVNQLGQDIVRDASQLLRERERMLDRFVRRNRATVEFDREGNPARRGELLVMDLAPDASRALRAAGFGVLPQEELEGLGFAVTRLAVPEGMSLAEAERQVSLLAPHASVASDAIHFQSGTAPPLMLGQASASAATTVPVGIIDGAASARIGRFPTRGFAEGAPRDSNHGSAIAHLLLQAGVSDIRVADVYGSDPAGGNALAIARGLGWLVAGGSKVVTVSLVGPRNALLERAIAAVRREGAVVVAAVGNDGPAAPPAYPASYDGVVAITGVDGNDRALIEAGRALHLDYAAPGADIIARDARNRRVRLRGTSYATQLAAARIAQAMAAGGNWRTIVDREAVDLGEAGADTTFGRGLLCARCAGR